MIVTFSKYEVEPKIPEICIIAWEWALLQPNAASNSVIHSLWVSMLRGFNLSRHVYCCWAVFHCHVCLDCDFVVADLREQHICIWFRLGKTAKKCTKCQSVIYYYMINMYSIHTHGFGMYVKIQFLSLWWLINLTTVSIKRLSSGF